MGAGCGLRMILHAEDGVIAVPEPFQCLIVQVQVSDLNIARERIGIDRDSSVGAARGGAGATAVDAQPLRAAGGKPRRAHPAAAAADEEPRRQGGRIPLRSGRQRARVAVLLPRDLRPRRSIGAPVGLRPRRSTVPTMRHFNSPDPAGGVRSIDVLV